MGSNNTDNRSDDPLEITIARRPSAQATGPTPSIPNKPTYTIRKPTVFAAGAGGRVSIGDWLRFASEMRLAVESGLPLLNALNVLEQSDPRKRVREAAAAVRESLSQGRSFDRAMAAAADIPPLVRILTDIGNRFGRLEDSFSIIEDHYQWLRDIRRALTSAFLYPFMVITLGLLIRVGTVVIIASMKGTGATSAFVSAATALWLPVMLAGAVAWMLASFFRHPKIRPVSDRVALTFPLAGSAAKAYSLAVFFRILAAGIKSGIPVTVAWNAASASCPNLYIGQRLNQQLYRLQDGESLADTLRHSGVADTDAGGMMASGESVAEVPQLVEVLSHQYTTEAYNLIVRRAKAIMPFLIIAVGVGFFLFSPAPPYHRFCDCIFPPSCLMQERMLAESDD